MRYDVFFTIEGPGGILEVPNRTNPVDSVGLAELLAALADNLPGNKDIGLATVGVRVVAVPGGEADEYDPVTGKNLSGKVAACCECGAGYPAADLLIREHIHCVECRKLTRMVDGRKIPIAYEEVPLPPGLQTITLTVSEADTIRHILDDETHPAYEGKEMPTDVDLGQLPVEVTEDLAVDQGNHRAAAMLRAAEVSEKQEA